MKPHKHAELIKAWADGAEIQVRAGNNCSWSDAGETPRRVDSLQYRIKPEPKPDVVRYLICAPNKYTTHYWLEVELLPPLSADWKTVMRITRDSETNELKSAEVLK